MSAVTEMQQTNLPECRLRQGQTLQIILKIQVKVISTFIAYIFQSSSHKGKNCKANLFTQELPVNGGIFFLEVRGSRFLRNVGKFVSHYVVSRF
jgi:hypothetical protein